jgi:cytochrome c5
MNSNKIQRYLLLAFVLLFCACSAALYIPTISDADRTGISTENLLIGRTLYTNRCGSCHNLHLPEQYTSKHWEQEMPEMQGKAKISDSDAKLIIQFLLARSKPE